MIKTLTMHNNNTTLRHIEGNLYPFNCHWELCKKVLQLSLFKFEENDQNTHNAQ
jgi:hypothetical protein